jgi:hypothetical protein
MASFVLIDSFGNPLYVQYILQGRNHTCFLLRAESFDHSSRAGYAPSSHGSYLAVFSTERSPILNSPEPVVAGFALHQPFVCFLFVCLHLFRQSEFGRSGLLVGAQDVLSYYF